MKTKAVLLPLLLLALPAAADETQVRATLEPQRIGVDETATLTIEAQGGGFGQLRFQPGFHLENFAIAGGPYEYQDVRLGNGSLSRSFRLSWRLRPLSTGTARVRGMHIRLNGQTIPLGSREVQVQEEPTGLSAPVRGADDQDDPFDRLFGRLAPPWDEQRPARPDVFLRAEVQPVRPVVGQQVLYTVYLFTLNDVNAVVPSSLPGFKGFWVKDIPQPQKLPTDMVEVDGKRYGRVILLQKALFALRPGPHPIEPTTMDLLVRTVNRTFFGPPVARQQQIQLRTPAMAVDVQELPPAPAGFAGAVGRMALSATIEPTEVRMGDAATVTLTLSGTGNLHGVPDPRLPEVPGLTVLPPQEDGEEKVDGTTIQATRIWSYAVVPERAGSFRLPVPRISFYDPAQESYGVAAAEPLRLRALPAPAVSAVTALPESSRPEPLKASAASGPQPSFWRSSWRKDLPWALALPSALALVAVLLRKRNASHPHPARITGREARHRLEQALSEAADESRPRQAAARIEEALRDFLDARWQIPPGTPSTRWGGLLTERGAEPEAAAELVRLADDLHYMRYAPQLSTCDTLCSEALGRCRRLARRLA